jgi:hypothetical protein
MHIKLSIHYIIQTLAHREYIAREDTVQELFLLSPNPYPFVSFIITGIQCEPVCHKKPFFKKESFTKETRLFLLRKNCVQVFGEVLLHQNKLVLD